MRPEEKKLLDLIQQKKVNPKAAGGGTTPGGRPAAKRAPVLAAAKSKPVQRLGSVVVIEPERRLAALLDNQLKALALEPQVTASGAEALQFVQAQKPLAIILEQVLPDTTAFACASRLLALPQCGELPILLLADNAEPKLATDAVMVGIQAVFGKPLKLPEFMAQLKELIHYDQLRAPAEPAAVNAPPGEGEGEAAPAESAAPDASASAAEAAPPNA